MDQKLVLCMTSLKEEAEAARRGAPSADLNALIADVSDLCKQSVSDEDLSFAIAVIFDREAGVFNIVDLLMTIKERTVVKTRESCFTFLAGFIEQIGDRALPHVAFVKDKCLNIFRREDSKVVQAAALLPILSMLQTNVLRKSFSSFHVDWSLGEMLLQEYRKAKTSGTLKSNILTVLGFLVEYFPAMVSEEDVTSLLKICLDTLEEQLRQTNKDPLLVLVSGVMNCLDSLLTWYDATLPAGGSVEHSRRLYTFLRQVLCYREDMKRYEVVKAGLRLLARHAELFALRLVQDSKEILDWLQIYCTHANALLRDAGLSAFSEFMSQVSRCLVNEGSRLPNVQETYQHFMSTFFEILDAQHTDAKLLLSLAVRGVGKLSPAILKFSGKEVLKQVFHRLISFGGGGGMSRGGDDREYLLGHSDTLIGAFADIVIHLENVEDFMVSFIAEITGNIFYQFPHLFPKQKQASYISLSLLFKSLYLKGTIFSIFLNNIVWSSLERAMESTENSGETEHLWPHYVELWSHLLDFSIKVKKEYFTYERDADSENLCNPNGEEMNLDLTQFQAFIFDTIIRCIMKVLLELNLKYRVRAGVKQPSTSLVLEDTPETAVVEPETEMEMIEPLNILDMQKYLNLVEFIQGLLSEHYAHLFLKWVYSFGCCIMELSTQYPLISGHYKLLMVTIKIADARGWFQSSEASISSESYGDVMKLDEEWKFLITDNSCIQKVPPLSSEEQDLCKVLFRKYLQEVLVASRRYKFELLASCLHLCLSAPPGLIQIGSLIVPMQTALKVGLRYTPLASVAMDALERWRQFYPRELDRWLPDIVCSLSDYLAEVASTELSEGLFSGDPFVETNKSFVRIPESASRSQVARLRQIRAKATQAGPFELNQLRIQKFLGQIGRFNHCLLPEVDLLQAAGTGGLAWDSVDHVLFTIPFRDVKHDVWLDSLLPRVVELALSSSDRRMKVIASELLQALCLVMLGNSAKGPLRQRNEKSHSVYLDKIYKKLFPAILRLAVDVEPVTRQLFNEFVKQLIHWYTSNLQKENPETMALLDAILDGLVDADNGLLREFCASCFGEFMSWSVRHAPPEVSNFVNVKSMLRRLYNRMDHPNPYKRLGASMAAYCIYPVLRANPSIVDRHIFEMIFFCIKSLQLAESDDTQIGTVKQLNRTLDNYMKLVERNIGALLYMQKERSLFFSLENLLEWLLNQTGQLQEKCRSQCMKVLSFIGHFLPVGSLAAWFRSRLGPTTTIHDITQGFDFEVEGQPSEEIGSVEEACHRLSVFIRSLHWFAWALKNRLITTEELKMNTRSIIVVKSFLSSIFIESDSSSQWSAVTPGQREAHQRFKCAAIIYLLGFIKQILDCEFDTGKKGVFISQEASKKAVNIRLLQELIPVDEPKFYETLCLALLCPRDLGFVITDPHDAETVARLALSVIQMLTVSSAEFKLGLTQRLGTLLNENKSKYDLSLMDFIFYEQRSNGDLGLEDVRSLLKGYRQLHLSGSLLPVLGEEEARKLGSNLMLKVFEIRCECPPVLESVASEMLSLSLALGARVQYLVELCLNEKITMSSNARKVTSGGIFYLNFRKVIVQAVKFSFKDCHITLLNAAVKNSTARLLLISLLDDYLKSTDVGGQISREGFLKDMLMHIRLLQPCGTSDAGLADKQFLLGVIHKLLIIDESHDLLNQGQSGLQFFEDTYIAFFNGFHNPEDSGSHSTFHKDANLVLTIQCLALLPCFLKPPFKEDFQSRLACTVTKVVSEHLLVREADLPAKSNQRSNYFQILGQLLEAVSLSCSLVLLEVIFPLLLHPPKFAEKNISEAIRLFAEGIGDRRVGAFNICIQILNDDTKIPKLRRAVIERVFIHLVHGASGEFVATWYATHIKTFVEMLGKQPSGADVEKEEESLLIKICHYFLVEHLFLKVDATMIKEMITPLVSNASLMKQTMSESRAKNDPVKKFPENSSLWRELHIAGYKCLAAIALCTQEQEKIFSVLFKEGPTGMIWQHLIDTDKIHDNLPVQTDQLSVAYHTVKAIKAEQKMRNNSQGMRSRFSSLSSQYFVGAGLSQEPVVINTFVSQDRGSKVGIDGGSLGTRFNLGDDDSYTDPTEIDSYSLSAPGDVVDGVLLDQDDLDLHPCMAVVLRLIESLHLKFGTGQRDMPEWMKGLHSTLQNSATEINVRLFLTKVVTKAWKVFVPYSQTWFIPIVQTILLDPVKSGGKSFHYLLRDICITLLQWKFGRPPDTKVASAFINHLMAVAAHGSSQVLRANVDIIRLFLEYWKDEVELEKRIIISYLYAGGNIANSSNRMLRTQRLVGLQLLGAIVVSGLPMYNPVRDQFPEKDLYHALLQNLSFGVKEVYEASGELLGMALKQRHQAAQDLNTTLDEEILEGPLKQILLNFVRDSNLDCFLNVLNRITLQFPQYIEGLASIVMDMLPKLHGIFKTIALGIFLRFPKCLPTLLNILIPILNKLLTHRDEAAQLKSLELLMELVRDAPDRRINERVVPVLCETFGRHENLDCRQQYYNILISLYEREGFKSDKLIVRALLSGLTDTADVVRLNLQNFWHTHLSHHLGDRLTQMINQMYDPTVEESWAQYTNVLLLKLCEDSVDYKRSIFNAPLSDCEFHEQTINTSWLGSSLPMTPLFSLSQYTSQHTREGRSQVILLSQEENSDVPRQVGMIQASINPTLSQTQDTLASSSLASQESILFAMPQRPTRTKRPAEIQDAPNSNDLGVPRRRILQEHVARSQIIRSVVNAKHRRESNAARQATERANKVHIMRQYRIGELPDIEIKYQEIIAPLVALAEKDATFARLLLTLICRAVYSQAPSHLPQDNDQIVKACMKKGIEEALESTQNGISFVSCLEALCLEDPEIWIRPKLVGSASLKSNNFHPGILVLERMILHENSKDTASPVTSSKRHKGISGGSTEEKPKLEEAWLELAHLYTNLGEDDVVLSLYRNNLTKRSVTHEALEAQLGGDSSRGLILYDRALDSVDDNHGGNGVEPSQIEQDIWYNQRLTCLVDLNRWQQILADTLVQVQDTETSGPDLQRLWDPNVQEPYLGLFVQGAVKVATYRSLAAEFIFSSLEDFDKREFLMKHFGSQLVTLAVVDEQLDRARFYLSYCYKNFRKQWSALHPFAMRARHQHVQKLQKIAELDEYIDIATKQQLSEIPRKIKDWRHRWPSFTEDSVEAWDDIVQNRLVFFHKFQGLINKQLGSGATDVKQTFAFKLEEERAHIFSQAANGLAKQGAYTVAQKYMEEHNSAQKGLGTTGKFDYASVKGLVKLRCLQARRVKTVQASESIGMLKQVLSYIKSNAQKPGIEHNPVVRMGFKLLEAGVSFQLGFSILDGLPKSVSNPSDANEHLSLLGSAYMAYSNVFSNQFIAPGSTPDAKLLRHLAKTSLKFSHFCDELLKSTKNMDWSSDVRNGIREGHSTSGLPPASIYPSIIVRHMMKALKFDTSLQAQHKVARLLALVGQYPDTHPEFLSLVEEVPSWVFIPWIPQMLAVMDEKVGALLVGILEEIANLHPQALYFPFHVSEKDFGPTAQKRTLRLAVLLKNIHLRGFIRAMEDLTFPEQRLRDGLGRLKNCLIASDKIKAKVIFAEVFEDCLDVNAMEKPSRQAGEYNRKFARDWSKRVQRALGPDGDKLLHMDEKGFMIAVKDLLANLQKAMQDLRCGVMSLSQLSTWLTKFDVLDTMPKSFHEIGIFSFPSDSSTSDMKCMIEIPGQYSGFHEPSQLHHVKLLGFDQTLVSLSSKQRPKILTMRGSDERDYKFIVKGGEDLRLDQRIEQLFEVMNSILKKDSAAARRGLSIRTYSVVPVSKSCGLLQFVEDTRVLEDVVKDGLVYKLPSLAQRGKDAATQVLNKLRSQHQGWVSRRGGSKQNLYDCFTNLYKKVGYNEVTGMLTEIQSQLPWDTLKAGVSRWATSAESYLALRSQFSKSLSVISICGYIAGVGDRHLANTLVDMRSGSLVPIDFGYSFGTGVILLQVPELVPFRLTKQLTDFLLPLDALGLLRTDMVHTLSALHANREVISAVVEVFVKEPLVEWKNEAMKTNSIREKRGEVDELGFKEDATEVSIEQQHVELKVENAQRKLQLWNPAVITISELRSSMHANKPYLAALEAIVKGSPDKNVRARMNGNYCESVGVQVDCLIDMATDPNLLGRIWSGWQPWV